jgi:hypothetical protein
MDRCLSEKIVTARKDYICDASIWWLNSECDAEELHSDDQLAEVKAAEADNWMIRKGQTYLRGTGVIDGEIFTYRARIGMNRVCAELDLFPDY